MLQTRAVNSFITDSCLDAMTQNNNKLAQLQNQVNTGKSATSYVELVDKTSITGLVSSKQTLSILNSKIQNNQTLAHKLLQMENAMRTISEEVIPSSMNTLMKAANPASGGVVPVATLAQQQLATIMGLLNTTFNGELVFAGSQTNTQSAVGDIVNNSSLIGSAPSARYYLGDSLVQTDEIADGTNLSYGITAAHPAFVQLIGAQHLMIAGNFSAAQDAMNLAKTYLGQAISSVGNASLQVHNRLKLDENVRLNMKNLVSEAEDTDLVSVMPKIMMLEAQMRATYILTQRVTQLSIADYMR